ncbi:MAG: chaperone protein DnaJ [Actinomycetota bacterium]|nr:MAG: chaperone protein DnaJ [Actinomycetota bacterium]
MARTRDLYEILGVPRDATQEEIKRAYRRLARQYHPDVNPSADAEERFKEIAAAYEILSDPEKRAQYDRYGQGLGPMDFPFGDIADIFEAFFGTGGFGRRTVTRRTRTRHGEDLYVEVPISFEEAAFGTHRTVEVERLEPCGACEGSGVEPGTGPTRCRTCGGTGQVQDVRRSIFGTVMTARPCVACDGTGEEILTPCRRCRGAGRIAAVRSVPIELPAGVTDGLELRVSGAGNAGVAGGRPGDLYIQVRVAEHPVFERRGQDLFAVLEVPMEQAALGAELEIDTLEGPERIRIEPGTSSGTVVRLKGRGMPSLGRRGRGDLFVEIRVLTPTDLTDEERRLLERFAELRGHPVGRRARAVGTLRRPEPGERA